MDRLNNIFLLKLKRTHKKIEQMLGVFFIHFESIEIILITNDYIEKKNNKGTHRN
jgi:hypothetical protein